jgi:hypothetical protein
VAPTSPARAMRSSLSGIRLEEYRRGAAFALREVYSDHMPPPLAMSFTDSIKCAQRRTFYDQHQLLAVSMIAIVLILPFVGLLVSGLFGAIEGALVSFAAYYLAPYVVPKLGL